jgi:hypothetical protein
MAGHKALLFLPGYGGIGCEILAAVRETRLSAEKSHCPSDVGSWHLADFDWLRIDVRFQG